MSERAGSAATSAPSEEERHERIADAARRVRRGVRVFVVAVGLLLLVLLMLREDESPVGEVLYVTLEAPLGEVAGWSEFAWRAPEDHEGHFEVKIYKGGTNGVARREIASSGVLEASPWAPEPSVTAEWPETIEWELHVFDAEGELEGVWLQYASSPE